MRDRVADELRLLPTFVVREGRSRRNPKIEHLIGLERGRRRRFATPGRAETVETLAEQGMLPAIYFIFSRAGCDAAAVRLAEAGVRLTDSDQKETIRRIADTRTAHLSDADLSVLDYGRWITCLEAGVAAHHAGLVPAFKETVEELFALGLLGVVFATETLALGINMPARTVVLESLSRFDGETHRLMQPGDYTQLTGRAGRRGIDLVGYGVVLHSIYVRFYQVTEIAAAGSHPLRSSFRPTYNMAANLVANYPREKAERLLEASFAQYQRVEENAASRSILDRLGERLEMEESKARCELGSVDEFRRLLETDRGIRSLHLDGRLHPGDVVDIPAGPRQGRYVVLKRIRRQGGGMRLLTMSTSGRTTPISPRELVAGSLKAGTLELPLPLRPGDRRFRQETMRMLRKIPPPLFEPKALPRQPNHSVAGCPDLDSHLRWAAKADRTRRRYDQLSAEVGASGGLVEEFGAIEKLLEEFEYLNGWALTPRGERLRFIYNEMDLLLAEAIETGIFWSLTPAELAALASCFVYEPRSESTGAPEWSSPKLADRWSALEDLWRTLERRQRKVHLPPTRAPEPGFSPLAYEWALGAELEDLPGGFQPGDFVRVMRQLVDLLRQLRVVAPELADDARAALSAIDRGVVAAMGVG
jgi:ATP-dependent RNA helicase HelY